MNNLSPAVLKGRLEALPAREAAANQAARFELFRQKTADARRDAETAAAGAAAAAPLLPDDRYADIGKNVRRAARRAARLRDKLTASVEEITTSEVDQTFAGLGQTSRGALDLCKKVWRQKIEDKLKGRKELVNSISASALGSVSAPLRQTIQDLEREAQNLPLKPADAQRLTKLLAAFDSSVQQLQLDGPVGEFLQALASDSGAPLALTHEAAVRTFLDQNGLWKVFRVRLS